MFIENFYIGYNKKIFSSLDGCVAAGGHFNPYGNTHGGPNDEVRHVGDLGNIDTPEGESTTLIDIVDEVITLYDATEGILNRTLVIHEGEDDLGDGDSEDSSTTGNAGSRVACGIVELRASPMEPSCADLCGGDFKAGIASVTVMGSSDDSPVSGNVLMIQGQGDDDRVFLRGEISGLESGPHGFHIHEIGSTDGKYCFILCSIT